MDLPFEAALKEAGFVVLFTDPTVDDFSEVVAGGCLELALLLLTIPEDKTLEVEVESLLLLTTGLEAKATRWRH